MQFLRWLCDALPVRFHVSRADSGLGLGPAGGKAVADKKNVGALASIRHGFIVSGDLRVPINKRRMANSE